MNKWILGIAVGLYIFLCLAVLTVFAETGYVLFDTKTGQVVDISRWNDAVAEPGQEKALVDDIIEIRYPVSFYKYANGKVELDAAKYNTWQLDQQKKESDAEMLKYEKELIQKRVEKMAYDQLKGEGVVFEKISDKDFEDVAKPKQN